MPRVLTSGAGAIGSIYTYSISSVPVVSAATPARPFWRGNFGCCTFYRAQAAPSSSSAAATTRPLAPKASTSPPSNSARTYTPSHPSFATPPKPHRNPMAAMAYGTTSWSMAKLSPARSPRKPPQSLQPWGRKRRLRYCKTALGLRMNTRLHSRTIPSSPASSTSP